MFNYCYHTRNQYFCRNPTVIPFTKTTLVEKIMRTLKLKSLSKVNIQTFLKSGKWQQEK